MSKKSFIDTVKVKDPCTEDWEHMSGNERVRFCSHCSKHVNNLSEMTRKEAMRLVRDSGGNLCVRYIQDPKTKRPMFAEQLLQITRRVPGLAAGVMTASMALSSHAFAQAEAPNPDKVVIEQETGSANKDERPENTPDEPASGSITGTINDANGAVIPNVALELTNVSTNEVRSAFTNDEGVYHFTDLVDGKYTILFKSTAGFNEKTITNVSVSKGKETVTNTSLDVSEEMVTVGMIAITAQYETPLANAVQNEDIELVKDLIAHGADVNGKDNGKITPLFIAVGENNIEMVQLLLDFGAKVNIRDEDKRTPLMRVDSDTTAEMVKLLLRYGAKIDLKDEDGNTALITAANESSSEVVKALVDGGADLDVQNNNGETALMKAGMESTRILLEAGAKVNLKDKDGDTALDWTSDEDMIALLISYGATGKVKAEKKDENTFVVTEPEN